MDDIKKQLTELHNVLYSVNVEGENVLKIAVCISTLRNIIQNLETETRGE